MLLRRPKQYFTTELNEKLTKVQNESEEEIADDITNWKWQKVSHDFL